MNAMTPIGAPPLGVLLIGALVLGGCGESGLLGPDPAAAPHARTATSAEPKNLVVAAAGLEFQPTILPVTLPVPSAGDILDARFVWAGRGATPAGDPTIVINGTEHEGELVAVRQVAQEPGWLFFYQLDATGIVVPGNNLLFVDGFDPGGRASGIALVAIVRDGTSPWTDVRLVLPGEFVHGDTPGRETGQVVSFPLAPAAAPRTARLCVIAADCASGRPDRTWWAAGSGPVPADLVGAGTPLANRLDSAFGARIDVLQETGLPVPAGAGWVAYQLESPPGGDSILHVLGAICTTGEPGGGCEGSIAGIVWRDADRDGAREPGEPPLPGVRVRLEDGSGGALGDVVTGADGRFAFDALCDGPYVVTVDEATLPPGLEPTTCGGGGDCSPADVVLAGGTAVTLEFGWAAEPGALCLFGPGFWKHEIDVAAGRNPGRGRLDAATLADLLAVVAATTAADLDGGDGVISLDEASAILHGRGDACARARRHYLATLLNFAFSGANGAVPVDVDGDGVTDMTFAEAIEAIDGLLAGGAGCREAQRMAASIHDMPDPDCACPG